MKIRFNIGDQFIRQGRKNKYTETITDILKTYNNAGELVKIRYVASHDFCGQKVIDSDIVDATIARGLIKNG
jgi:hypothetical protein